jgi:hypothetical protein
MGTSNRTLPSITPETALVDCPDCAISRLMRYRLCRRHWLEFLGWWSGTHKNLAYRRATPTERDHAVHDWVATLGP